MARGLYLRSGGILISLYTFMFLFMTGLAWVIVVVFDQPIQIAGMALSPAIFGFIIAFVFLGIQFLISPWLMDLQLSWLYSISWGTPDILPPDMRDALYASMEKHNFTIAKVGIIHDQMPNAFTYGRFTKNARMVFTEGIIDLLDADERVAVLEHEVGHIVNKDFIFMTLARAVPLLLYYTYLTSRSTADMISRSMKGSDSEKDPRAAIVGGLWGVAIISYIFYWISDYIVLFLSRSREYLADHFSVIETGNANAMSTALVKVGYGLVITKAANEAKLKDENLDSRERRNISRRTGFMKGLGAMGLADVKTTEGLVMQAYGTSEEISPDAVAAAAAWDLHTPWAAFLELSSTHPLTGKRLRNLDSLAPEVNQEPKYPSLGKVKPPESLWDEFLVDLFAWQVLPILAILIPIAALFTTSYLYNNLFLGLGAGLIISSGMYFWRINLEYPGSIKNYDKPDAPRSNVLGVMTDMTKDGYYEASPIRGKPIIIEGTLIGRGTPGYYLSEDFVVRDETGLIVVDSQSLFGWIGNLFSAFRLRDKMGKKARVVGWYHRSTRPYIKLHRAYFDDEGTIKNYIRGSQIFITWIFMIIGIALLGYGVVFL